MFTSRKREDGGCSSRLAGENNEVNQSGRKDVLNLTFRDGGSLDVRGSRTVLMAMPDWRALGGMKERKSRADRAVGEKGLNLVVTSVMNLVIILGDLWGVCARGSQV